MSLEGGLVSWSLVRSITCVTCGASNSCCNFCANASLSSCCRICSNMNSRSSSSSWTEFDASNLAVFLRAYGTGECLRFKPLMIQAAAERDRRPRHVHKDPQRSIEMKAMFYHLRKSPYAGELSGNVPYWPASPCTYEETILYLCTTRTPTAFRPIGVNYLKRYRSAEPSPRELGTAPH